MHYFHYKDNHFYCEDVDLLKVAEEVSTPCYVYSLKTFRNHFNKLRAAFSYLDPFICYSAKANSNLTLLNAIKELDGGLDVVSGGELFKAQKVGFDSGRIVYAGVGKTEHELKKALEAGIYLFNVESESELRQIDRLAGILGITQKVALRFNPYIKAPTHRFIRTAGVKDKFGIDRSTILKLFLHKKEFKNVEIVGIHVHIGSQIMISTPFVKAIKKVSFLIRDLRRDGHRIELLDIGGGLAAQYKKEENPNTAEQFAKAVGPFLKSLKLRIIIEPGRFIVANAGVLLTRIIHTKKTPCKNFLVTDAGMHSFMRPALYGGYHEVMPIVLKGEEKKKYDVVGPICESGDFLARDRMLPEIKEGDFIAIMGAGAYGYSMASNYNSHPLPAEVVISRDRFSVVKPRQDY